MFLFSPAQEKKCYIRGFGIPTVPQQDNSLKPKWNETNPNVGSWEIQRQNNCQGQKILVMISACKGKKNSRGRDIGLVA